tara:strand:- start:1554 stop:3416 length:1863 start_codon:yes stop_codon:yes gene_type:complete
MCGINGFTFEDHDLIDEMNSLLIHRGPDDSGTYVDSVSLGHRRLKIIDLSEMGRQPMSDLDKKIIVTFNGEIYNYKDLKSELSEYSFKSDSDTEVILYAYKKWGLKFVDKLNGMWALAIYDKERKNLILSRDRLGKKPLFYTRWEDDLIFSSEIKPLFVHDIVKKLNKKAVSSYLSYRYVLGEESMFQGIYKVPPAHNLIFDLNKNEIAYVFEYWDLSHNEINIDYKEAKRRIDKVLLDSTRLRQVSDVPIGSINSGGLDSSLLSGMMSNMHDNPINTFTVKFPDEGFDETEFARLLADHCNTNHREIVVDIENFLDVMKDYSSKKDEPIGVPNEIALYLLFKEIKKYASVVLSGEGADEIFAGYSRIFRSPEDYEKIKEIRDTGKDYSNFPSLFKKYKGRYFDNKLEHFLYLYNYFPNDEKNSFLKEEFLIDHVLIFQKYFNENRDYKKNISYVFLKLHLPGLFARLDNSSMASAVEARCPFVDYRLVEEVYSLPFSLKNPWKSEKDKEISKNKSSDEIAEVHDETKYLLKKIAEDYIPNEIVYRKKMGFPLPLQKWFTGSLFEEGERLLLSEDSKITEVLYQDKLREWIERGRDNGDKLFGQKLWMLISLELWLREWF